MHPELDRGSRPVSRGQARTGTGRYFFGDGVGASIHSHSLRHARQPAPNCGLTWQWACRRPSLQLLCRGRWRIKGRSIRQKPLAQVTQKEVFSDHYRLTNHAPKTFVVLPIAGRPDTAAVRFSVGPNLRRRNQFCERVCAGLKSLRAWPHGEAVSCCLLISSSGAFARRLVRLRSCLGVPGHCGSSRDRRPQEPG